MGHVLLIEDDADLVRALARLLRESGHEVSVAFAASEGYLAALQERPDAVILDLALPCGTGPQLMTLLQVNPDAGGVPIIAMPAPLRDVAEDRLDLGVVLGRVEAVLGPPVAA